MALSARPLSAPSGPNVSSAHMPAGGRNVASVTYAQIDEISPKAEVFADPNYNFQGFTEWMQNRRPEPPQLPANTSSNFETSSTTFLHLLSQQQRDSDLSTPGGPKGGTATHCKQSHSCVRRHRRCDRRGDAQARREHFLFFIRQSPL